MLSGIDHSATNERAGVSAIFREARENAGLSHRELASMLGTSAAAIWDIETFDDELFECYSPVEVRLMATALGTDAAKLLKCASSEAPITGAELVDAIYQRLSASGESIKDFENRVGWRVQELLDSPEHLLSDVTIDGLQWLCEALQLDWRRVIAGL